MSIASDRLGMALAGARKQARSTLAGQAQDVQQLAIAKAEAGIILNAIKAGRRIFIGTSPTPPSGGAFQDGDLYFVREA